MRTLWALVGLLLHQVRRRTVWNSEATDWVGDAIGCSYALGLGRDLARYYYCYWVCGGGCIRRFHSGTSCWHLRFWAHQAGSIFDSENNLDGMLVVRRLSPLLSCVYYFGWSIDHWAMGPEVRPHTNSVHAALASDHLLLGMAFRVDWNYCDFRANFPAFVDSLQHRSTSVGHIGIREPASSVLVTTGGDVCLLSQRCITAKRYA